MAACIKIILVCSMFRKEGYLTQSTATARALWKTSACSARRAASEDAGALPGTSSRSVPGSASNSAASFTFPAGTQAPTSHIRAFEPSNTETSNRIKSHTGRVRMVKKRKNNVLQVSESAGRGRAWGGEGAGEGGRQSGRLEEVAQNVLQHRRRRHGRHMRPLPPPPLLRRQLPCTPAHSLAACALTSSADEARLLQYFAWFHKPTSLQQKDIPAVTAPGLVA